MKRSTITKMIFAAGLAIGWTAASIEASVITFAASQEFSGGTSPVGPNPWITATFQDADPGSVTLTLTATNLTLDEFVSRYQFNLDPTMDPTALVFSSPTTVGSFTTPTISKGNDQFKADGDGYFDVKIDFATEGGDTETRFTGGDSISYTISGIAGLSASSFNFMSLHDGSPGIFPDASHVQGIGSGSLSGWVSVPEPATLGLLAMGGVMLLHRRRLA